ncbi:MAG: hypothetical protein WC910_06165 [Bacteroidales bacterium]|jgi:phage gpG-like protein
MITQTVSEFEADVDALEQKVSVAIERGLQRCLPVVKEGVSANFEGSVDPDGNPWPPRKIEGDGHPLLIQSGELKAAATGGHIAEVNKDELRIGVDKGAGGGGIPGAGSHNYGYGAVPQREFMGLNEEYLDKCQDILAEEVMKAFQ